MRKIIKDKYNLCSAICIIAAIFIIANNAVNNVDPSMISGRCNDVCIDEHSNGCVDHSPSTCGGFCVLSCWNTWETAIYGPHYYSCDHESDQYGYLCSFAYNVVTCRKLDCECLTTLLECAGYVYTGSTETHNLCTTVAL